MKDKIGHQIEWVGREAGIRAVLAVGLLMIWPLWAWSQEQAVRASLLSESLRRGLELADAYNWSDAGPYFAEAEKGKFLDVPINGRLSTRESVSSGQTWSNECSRRQHCF